MPKKTPPTEELLDQFVSWFEASNVGEQFDAFIKKHAAGFCGEDFSGEQKLEWTALYQIYTQLFEQKLQEFVEGAGITVDDFLTAAKAANGLHDAYLQAKPMHCHA